MKKNFIFNFILTVSNLFFPLMVFPYLSRVLGADGIGICNFIISYVQNFIIVAALGMPVYGTREIAKVANNKDNRSKLFFELLSIHLSFTFLLLLIYIASIFLYTDFKDYKDLALLGGSLILFNVFSIEWLFAGINDFKYITIRSLFIRALSVFSIFIFVKEKDDFFIYFLILVSTVFLTVLVDVNYARKFVSKKIVLSFKDVLFHVKPIFILGIYMVLTSIYSVLPVTLLGFLSSKSSVGYYYGASKIIAMVISVFTALTTVMIPRLNLVLAENEKEKYLELVNKSLNIVITFGIPITFFIFLLANPIVMLLAGKDFHNSVFIIKIMAPIILIVAFAQVFVHLILNVNRKDKSMVLLAFLGMSTSLIINIIFIPYFAERATAFSQLIAELLVLTGAVIIARKVLSLRFPLKKTLLNLSLVLPFALIAYFFNQLVQNNLLIITLSGFFCGAYFFFMQIVIIKDNLVKELIDPIFFKIRNFF